MPLKKRNAVPRGWEGTRKKKIDETTEIDEGKKIRAGAPTPSLSPLQPNTPASSVDIDDLHTRPNSNASSSVHVWTRAWGNNMWLEHSGYSSSSSDITLVWTAAGAPPATTNLPLQSSHTTHKKKKGPIYASTYALPREGTQVYTSAEQMESAVRELSKLGMGEDITSEEFQAYKDQLSCGPPYHDPNVKFTPAQAYELELRHALYRLKAYKLHLFHLINYHHCVYICCLHLVHGSFNLMHAMLDATLYEQLSQGVSEDKLHYDTLKDYYPPDVLEQEEYFLRFQRDGTLDWSFYPDYCSIADLDDYQRLVPHNSLLDISFLSEYDEWDDYREFLHSYEVEQEYANFCDELSKKLKWLDAYVLVEMPLWDGISTRAYYQVVKIATGFPKIPIYLAHRAYYDYLYSVRFDIEWYNEKSFRDALDEVYKLNKFPLRQCRLKSALEVDSSWFEKEYYTCTANLTEEVAEDEARQFILESLKKLRVKPKYYEQYVKKKIEIARKIGLIPEVRSQGNILISGL
uniref:Uncharacterized protein n=1 Tax=Leersia perrieri TaxID=77586 RepID=A0A0D9VAR7_9ORYZ